MVESSYLSHFAPSLCDNKKKNRAEGALLLNFNETYYKSFYQVLIKGTKIFVFFVPFPFQKSCRLSL